MQIIDKSNYDEHLNDNGISALWRERDFVPEIKKYMGSSLSKVLIISGLRGTGKKLIKRIYYNGGMEMLIFTIFFAVIIVLFLLAHLLVCAALSLLLYALIYLDIYFFRSYKGKVFEDSVFIKRNLNQKTSIKINADECVIDVFHDELIEYLSKYVIDNGYVCLCSTHGHVIRHIEKVLGDKVEVIYDKDSYSVKDLKNLKKSFIKSCHKCSYCDKQNSCKLFSPKITRMYNVKIQRKDGIIC